MTTLERIISKMSRRDMSISNVLYLQGNTPIASSIPLELAVKEGYKLNPWVYVAIQKISSTASSVPWAVYGADGKIKDGHRLTAILKKPNPAFSMQDCIELISAWLQLSGTAYFKKVSIRGNETAELWPISPARLRPFAGKGNDTLISGYSVLKDSGMWDDRPSADFTPDNVIAIRLLDPANPAAGIGPLQTVADIIDVDNGLRKFNRNALNNRGVVDGVFTFKNSLVEKVFNSIKEKIKARFTGIENAREPLIIGDDATYTRMALTPVEMDFIESGKMNRDSIYMAFGLPPQLAGAQESSTYNNYEVSLRIFWESKIIPLLDQIKGTFNQTFEKELQAGEYIGYSLADVRCLKEADKITLECAKILFDIGVPVKGINELYRLGIPEFENWDKSYSGGKISIQNITATKTTNSDGISREKRWLIPDEKRDFESEADKRENIAVSIGAPLAEKMLAEMEQAANYAIENNESPQSDIYAIRDNYAKKFNKYARYLAYSMAETVHARCYTIPMEYRAAQDDDPLSENNIQALLGGEDSAAVKAAMDAYLIKEAIELREVYDVADNTVDSILAAMRKGQEENLTIQEIKDILVKSGAYSPERALALVRTMSTPIACVGQLAAALEAGAETKEWHISGFHTRKWHVARNGERVPAEHGRFSAQINSYKPRWPGDLGLDASDRRNCRCGLTFQ